MITPTVVAALAVAFTSPAPSPARGVHLERGPLEQDPLRSSVTLHIADTLLSCEGWTVEVLVPGLGTRGAWRRLAVASAGADLTLEATGLPGVISLLVAHCNGRPGYSLHGPLMWPPRQTERILHPRLRRTIRAKSHAPMMFALGPGGAKQPWPRCGQKRGDMWECLGVPLEEPVVLIAPAEAEVGWAIAFAQSVTNQEVHMTRAKWGRLLHVVNADLAGAADAIVTPWREAGRMGEPDRLRIRLKPDDSVDVHPLAAGTWWIAGTEARPSQDRFLEVSSPTTSAHRVPVLDLLSHPFEQTYTVALELGAVLQGLTLAADGTAAGGALVTLFEPLPTDDPPHTGDTSPKRTRWIGETISDERGRFEFSGLSRQPYSLLAVHPRLGRVDKTHPGLAPVTLRLEPTTRVVGRVWINAIPATGISVRVVPNHVDLSEATDPFSLLALPTTTDHEGRFSLGLPPQGRVELVVGGDSVPTFRRRLGSVQTRRSVTDLGDITLPPPVEVFVRLEAPGCALQAAGPVGTFGLSRLRATYVASQAAHRFDVPEPGLWWIEATCGGSPRAVLPPIFRVAADRASQVLDAELLPIGPDVP